MGSFLRWLGLLTDLWSLVKWSLVAALVFFAGEELLRVLWKMVDMP